MSGKITIIRHAPTEFNEKRIFMGILDIPVIKFDEKQIMEAKGLLRLENYTAIYSSPLRELCKQLQKYVGLKQK